ncbi:MAG: hypothetical protein AAF399_22800, partial [Bacteroidota bacterium]
MEVVIEDRERYSLAEVSLRDTQKITWTFSLVLSSHLIVKKSLIWPAKFGFSSLIWKEISTRKEEVIFQ